MPTVCISPTPMRDNIIFMSQVHYMDLHACTPTLSLFPSFAHLPIQIWNQEDIRH